MRSKESYFNETLQIDILLGDFDPGFYVGCLYRTGNANPD
jgi:hypothetical protein